MAGSMLVAGWVLRKPTRCGRRPLHCERLVETGEPDRRVHRGKTR
jgi:hypothetical protein